MAETTLDLRHLPKEQAYDTLEQQLDAVLEGIDDPIAAMATMSCLIAKSFGHLWVGFYRVVRRDVLLRVGPYQGTLGCLEIRFGAGVCGTAAREKRTMIVDDVDLFPGHIACDANSRSEIVVPVYNASGELIAVLDIDSSERAAFDLIDQRRLEHVVKWFAKTTHGVGHAFA
jgi:GAF domain-containing protein